MQSRNCYSSSHCSCCKLFKYSSQLFTNNLHYKDWQQLDSTITDSPLQGLGQDESFYHYVKVLNKQPVEYKGLPSWPPPIEFKHCVTS